MAMTSTKSTVGLVVWGGITLVIALIAVAYVRERLQPQETMPVLREVPAFSLTNQAGAQFGRGALAGKVWLAEIIFTRCAGPCLVMTRELAALRQELPPREDLQFVSLTADPAYDTPEVLARYAERFEPRDARWHLLTGPKADLYALAMHGLLLSVDENPAGAQAAKLEDLFIHSTRLVLVDRRGRLRAYFNGDGTEPRRRIADAVQRLLDEKTP